MAEILMRDAADDFDAFCIANALAKTGARVISISYNGATTRDGLRAQRSRFLVWAEITDSEQKRIDYIDDMISSERKEAKGARLDKTSSDPAAEVGADLFNLGATSMRNALLDEVKFWKDEHGVARSIEHHLRNVEIPKA
jgi:hypothetical protein